jgi:hypothetical protein
MTKNDCNFFGGRGENRRMTAGDTSKHLQIKIWEELDFCSFTNELEGRQISTCAEQYKMWGDHALAKKTCWGNRRTPNSNRRGLKPATLIVVVMTLSLEEH